MVKKVLLSILDFILFSNLFIAICAVAQGLVTYQLLDARPDKYVLAVIFFGTLAIYNFGMLVTNPKTLAASPFLSMRWVAEHHRMMISITLICVLCMIPLGLLYLSIEAQVLLVFTAVIAIGYNVPFLLIGDQKIGLKNIPGLRIFIIVTVWCISCVLLPIVELEKNYAISISAGETLLLAAKRFLFIIAITIPFDLHDIARDKHHALKTIPALVGEKKAYLYALLLLLLYLLLMLLFNKGFDLSIVALTISLFVTAWLIINANRKRNEYYYLLFLDGTMLLQYFLLLAVSLAA